MSYQSLGATKSGNTKSSVIAQFRSRIQEGHQIVSKLEDAIWKKYQSASDCDLSAKLMIAASSNKSTYTGKKLTALNLALDGGCEGKLEEARKLHNALNQLESVASSPGHKAGDPPNTPLIFVRPQDVLSTVESIVNTTVEQIKILADWAEKSDLEIAGDSFKNGMAIVIANAGEVAGEIIGSTAQKMFEGAAKNIKKGKFPWTIAFGGMFVIGAGIWLGGKFK